MHLPLAMFFIKPIRKFDECSAHLLQFLVHALFLFSALKIRAHAH